MNVHDSHRKTLFFRKPVPEVSDFPPWPQISSDLSPYMSINRTLELKDYTPIKERSAFWEKIYDNYYRHPVAPALSGL